MNIHINSRLSAEKTIVYQKQVYINIWIIILAMLSMASKLTFDR